MVWSALTTSHASLALVSARARVYRPAYSPFAALQDFSEDAFGELAQIADGNSECAAGMVLVTREPLPPQQYFEVLSDKMMDQMLGPAEAIQVLGQAPKELKAEDLGAMRELVELAKPGPFRARTHELGGFVGFKENGRLLAMSGERMQTTGYSEVSAVCAHPDARGRGMAARTVAAVTNAILARGDMPMLHVFSDNAAAIALYQKLGYVLRTQFHLTLLRRQPASTLALK